ncbi:transposase [Candidatus Woesearchaeota archaeon]|nr:transposase [Candidatus Woesearchaeota archaeon]
MKMIETAKDKVIELYPTDSGQCTFEPIVKEQVEEPVEIPKKLRLTYPQNWSAYNKAQTSEKHFIMRILDELVAQINEERSTGKGRPPIPIRDQIFAMCVHQYCGKSSRRTTCELTEAYDKHYLFQKLHFSTLLKFYENPKLTELLKQLIELSSIPLAEVENHFSVDSSGFSTSQYKRWFDIKYGRETNLRLWKKAHITSGAKTNIITAVKVTEGYEHDAKFLPELIRTTNKNFKIDYVSADKAYLSGYNLEVIYKIGAIPLIPFKANSRGRARGKLFWRRAYFFFKHNNSEFKKYYHLRSNVESTYSMIKRKIGHKLRAKGETNQTNEILVKCLLHNLIVLCHEVFELNLDIDFIDKNNLSTNQGD